MKTPEELAAEAAAAAEAEKGTPSIMDTLYGEVEAEELTLPEDEKFTMTGSLSDVIKQMEEDPAKKEEDPAKKEEDPAKKEEDPAKKPPLGVKKPEAKKEDLPTFEPVKKDEVVVEGSRVDLDDPSLTDDQKDRIELALYAETTGDAKYKGLAGKYQEYFKAHDEFVRKAEAADPDVEFDSDNEEYQQFLKSNQPVLSAREIKLLERGQILKEAEGIASNKFKSQLDEQEKEIRRIKTEPQAEKMVKGFREKIDKSIYPEHIAKLIEEKGIEEAGKQFAFEVKVYADEADQATRRVESFVKLAKGLDQFSEGNADHKWLLSFIDSEGDDFYQRGGAHRLKEGKQFLPRAHYHEAVKAGVANQYWTLTDSEVVDLLEVRATRDARASVDAEIKRLESLGFSRGVPAVKQAAQEEDESPAPKPRSSVVPGTVDEPGKGDTNPVFSLLGY